MTITPEDHARFTEQMRLAETGKALNQCPECQAYQLNGKPPTLHTGECSKYTPVDIRRRVQDT